MTYLVTDERGVFWWTGRRWSLERADAKRYLSEMEARGAAARVLGKAVPA